MGDCQKRLKEYLKAFGRRHFRLKGRGGWIDPASEDTCGAVPGRKAFCFKAKRRQILFEPRSEFKESGIEGSAQRGLVTCHRLAQYPDLFVGASVGPAGWGGRAVRTCL